MSPKSNCLVHKFSTIYDNSPIVLRFNSTTLAKLRPKDGLIENYQQIKNLEIIRIL